MATTASVPLMVTRDMKQQLLDLGWSKAEIVLMTPEEVHGRLKLGVKKATIDANVRLAKEGIVDLGGVDVTRRNPVTGEMETFITSRITKRRNPVTGEMEFFTTPVPTVNRAIDPVKVENDLKAPKQIDTQVEHKITTQIQRDIKQAPKKRIDQQTIRKFNWRRARIVNDVNLEKIDVYKMTPKEIYEYNRHSYRLVQRKKKLEEASRKQTIKQFSPNVPPTQQALKDIYVKARRRRKLLKKYSQNIRASLDNITNNLDEKLGPQAGGWKQFEKDVYGHFQSASRFVKKVRDESKIGAKTKAVLKNRWFRGAAGSVGLAIGFNLAIGLVQKTFFPKPAIPDEYEKGYDILDEYLTDYGSPLNLAKAAHKALRPYYSSVRSSLYTTTDAVINHNIALTSAKNAIGHTRY